MAAKLIVYLLVICSGVTWAPTAALHPDFNLDTFFSLNIIPVIGQDYDPSVLQEFIRLIKPYTDASIEETADGYLNTIFESLPGKGVNLTAPCYEDMKVWLTDLVSLKAYTLQMLDAFFKLPAGLSKGNILMLGAFDLCLGIKSPPPALPYFNRSSAAPVQAANYCIARMKLNLGNTTVRLPPIATCLPKSCVAADVDHLLFSIIHILKFTEGKIVPAGITSCKEPIPPQNGNTATLILLGVFGVVCLWATIVHLIARFFMDRRYWDTDAMAVGKDNCHVVVTSQVEMINCQSGVADTNVDTQTSTKMDVAVGKTGEGKASQVPGYIKLILCFSIVHNTNRLFAKPTGQLDYLNGIRVLSMWWIMLGHVHQIGIIFFDNQLEVVNVMKGYPQQLVLNATFAVDTFFLLSGLVVSYSLLKEVERQKSLLPLLLSYFRRIWRLTPLYGVILLVYMYIVPYAADGPFAMLANQEGSPTEFCKTHWWTTITYLNNFIPSNKKEMCMDWTWFLAADMQLFLLTPPILAVVVKFPKIGLSLLSVLLAACIGTVSGLVSLYGLPLTVPELHAPFTTPQKYDPTYEYIYDKPWQGGINYIFGVALAVLIVKLRPAGSQLRWNLGVMVLGWIVSLFLAYFAIFGLYYGGFTTKTEMTLPERTLYAALARPAWAFSIGWVIYACQFNYAFAVKSFLSLRIWTSLSRLTYAAFMVHVLILQLYLTSLQAMIHYTMYQVLTIFLSQIVAVYAIAYVVSVIIEMPLRRLEYYVVFRRV